MSGTEVKKLDAEGVRRSFEHGYVDVAQVSPASIGRASLEPGWKWSECVKPLVKTDLCQVAHLGYVISGSLGVVMADGNTFRVQAGDGYRIEPGHDAWVEG